VARDDRSSWVLKPRTAADVTFTFQRVTVAEARTTPIGRLVEITGLALNAYVTFGDSTVHIFDPTGSLRSRGVASAEIFAADSVRFVGRIAMRDGQVVLDLVAPTVLLTNRCQRPRS
jgi:RecJ-like exonuclease